ncbi:transmembrane channel-like protein 7 [Galleria mellonella]|uniref:Transmembrane channel-like protein 7 n=1 Tax=Galleria mellonella TaxID=7137 RepID=A0ABM3M8N8_GALME|nr:transmembrane channel-like protein 7 [Galleria mellonella]XP_052747777.1 transmembrane channel-like protein 7 [Galleria mellonella]
MSGGNSSKNKARSSKRQEGWEEAGGEFYQELYPGQEQELFENLQRADAAKLATLLPSKQARNTTTVKRVRSQNERRQSTYARTTQSRDIHLAMLPDLSENLSNEERTWEEIMQIKAMPIPMMQKRDLKARLQNATKLRLQGLEHLHWKRRKVWNRLRIRFSEIVGKLELWQSAMREIEGTFGTGVVSYFLFIRWLLFLTIFVSVIVGLFIILPNELLVERHLNCDEYETNSSVCCSQAYLGRNSTDSNVVLDVIQGTGWMERTILFYGVYSDQIYRYELRSVWDAELYYDMPLAYILVPITTALFWLIAIVRSAAKGFKEKLVESEGQFYMYCNLVFGGWDFCIHNEKSAKIKHKALFNEIKGCLEEQRFKEERQLRTREGQILIYFKRLFINVIVIIILSASGYLIYKTFNYSLDRLNDIAQSPDYAESGNRTAQRLTFSQLSLDKSESIRKYRESFVGQLGVTFLEFLPFLCIVVLNKIVPEIFGYLVQFEDYNPANILNITLLRTVLLRLSSLVVLLSQIYMYISLNGRVCSYNAEEQLGLECWETYVGQQLYKLILTDIAFQLFITFIINLPRACIARHTRNRFLKLIGEQDFYLPKHVLDIVYIQTIIWMGSFFCPFLPIVGTIFYFLIFYIKMFTCLKNCIPSPVVYRASKSKSLFMYVLLFGFVISIAPVGYSVAEILPSMNCGPYRGYDTVWAYVIQTFSTFPYFFREVIFLLGTSTFAVPAFAILLLLLYYYWAVATANRHMVDVLRNQLVLEGRDKQFLLNRLSAFIRQHQKRCERRNRASFADDDSSIRQSSR